MKYLVLIALSLSFVLMSNDDPEFIKQTTLKNSNKIDQPEELGKVVWLRNLEDGIQLSEQKGKPILLLFQEVPGCATCQHYGQGVLSHPLIVEAIETAFIPVAIFNNKGGEDAKILKYFREPSWNNPVVRIINSDKKDIAKRVAGNYGKLALVSAMKVALQKSQNPIPEYLNILEREFQGEQNGLREATVSMYCFWTGEKNLAGLPGVIETQPGFMGGKEVVQIKYDPVEIEYADVLKFAEANDCASHVFTRNIKEEEVAKKIVGNSISKSSNFKLDNTPKYYLSKTDYQYIPMTGLQAVLVNAEIGKGFNPEFLLSPRQLEYFKRKKIKKSFINVPLEIAWSWE